MRKSTLLIAFLGVLASLTVVVKASPALPVAEQGALWLELQEAKNRPAAGTLDTWKVIEDIALIKRTDGVSNQAAVLATVLKYDNGERFIVGDGLVAAAVAKRAEKKGLRERELSKLRARVARQSEMLSEEYEKAKKGRRKFLTRGVDFSLLVEKYVAGNHGDLVQAVNAFASKRAYAAGVTTKENPPFNYIVDSITMKKPLVLRQTGTDHFLVCVGFLNRGGLPYVIAADPEKIDFEEVSNADLILGKGEMAKRAREAAKGFDTKFGLAKKDRIFQVSGKLPPGIEIINWGQGRYASYSMDFTITDESVDGTFFPPALFPWF